MFETEGKKGILKKQNRLQGFSQKFKIKNKLEQTSVPSVYGELKLSELLSNELQSVKIKFDEIIEKLEVTEYERDQERQKVQEQQKSITKLKAQNK